MSELLPCPFCGADARRPLLGMKPSGKKYYTIGCPNYCCVSTDCTATKVIAKWNTRTPPKPASVCGECGNTQPCHECLGLAPCTGKAKE